MFYFYSNLNARSCKSNKCVMGTLFRWLRHIRPQLFSGWFRSFLQWHTFELTLTVHPIHMKCMQGRMCIVTTCPWCPTSTSNGFNRMPLTRRRFWSEQEFNHLTESWKWQSTSNSCKTPQSCSRGTHSYNSSQYFILFCSSLPARRNVIKPNNMKHQAGTLKTPKFILSRCP